MFFSMVGQVSAESDSTKRIFVGWNAGEEMNNLKKNDDNWTVTVFVRKTSGWALDFWRLLLRLVLLQ